MSNQIQPPPSKPLRAGWRWLRYGATPWPGLLLLITTAALYLAVPRFHQQSHALLAKRAQDFLAARQANIRYLVLFCGVLVSVLLLEPFCQAVAQKLRPRWRRAYTVYVLGFVCLLFSLALVNFGRHQFGGFDYNALLEIGWRQFLGQRMYVDFLTPTPPGFNLGIKYAMQVFGPTWDANLYLNCIFGCLSLVWLYNLFRLLGVGRVVALTVALAIECQSVLLLSFWWYNDTALVLSAVFLLTCLAYSRRPSSTWVALSYVASFTLLALMKPNIAGMALAGGVALLFLRTQSRGRLAILTGLSLALVAFVFFVNHISVSAMLAIYREVARERGGLSVFGARQQDKLSRKVLVFAFAFLAIPGLWLLPRLQHSLRQRWWPRTVHLMFFPFALLLSVYGVMSNGDFWQVECAPLIAVLVVFCYAQYRASYKAWFRHLLFAVLCADMASNIFLGYLRLRVLTIGPGMYFEWADNERLITTGPLKNMRVSGTMMDVQKQVEAAVSANQGPYYFGPRVDYNYFALGIASPPNRPAWWAPGTAFGRDQQSGLIRLWQTQGFNTLIFLRGDYTFYPPEFMKAIHQGYRRDDSYPRLTVYHRR